MFQHSCGHDLGELQHLSRCLYPKFKQPVLEDEVDASDERKLFKLIQPHAQMLQQSLYQHDTATGGSGGGEEPSPLRMFVVVQKKQPLPVASWIKIKDDNSFIKQCDSSIKLWEDVTALGPVPPTGGRPPMLTYYQYKFPPGMKNRDFLVAA